nr:abhydrolase domain-containing protein mpah [Quercus suber]
MRKHTRITWKARTGHKRQQSMANITHQSDDTSYNFVQVLLYLKPVFCSMTGRMWKQGWSCVQTARSCDSYRARHDHCIIVFREHARHWSRRVHRRGCEVEWKDLEHGNIDACSRIEVELFNASTPENLGLTVPHEVDRVKSRGSRHERHRIWKGRDVSSRRRHKYPSEQHDLLVAMSQFNIFEHTVRTQHTRDRPAGSERGRDNDLRLHVKQYIPKTNTHAGPGDVTIIGAHANGFPKELYEPLWDELLQCLGAKGRRIKGIWIADIASQGQSGVINESLLGPDVSRRDAPAVDWHWQQCRRFATVSHNAVLAVNDLALTSQNSPFIAPPAAPA